MTNAEKLEKAVKYAEALAADNSHGYSNVVDDNLGQHGDYDCGGFISAALKHAGIIPSGAFEPNEEYGNPWSYGTVLYPAGFKKMKFAKGAVKRGDILIKDGHHTELAISATQTVGAHSNYDRRRGDSSGREISVGPIYDGYWDYILRLDTSGAEKKKEEAKMAEKSLFTDVKTTDAHYKKYKALKEAGIMTGYSNGEFRPGKAITRKTLAIVAYRICKKAKIIK